MLEGARLQTVHLWQAAVLASALVIAALEPGCGKKPSSPKRPPPVVVVAEAVARDVPVYRDEIGTTTAFLVVAVQSQASGQIVGVHFQEGDDVNKGDRLFTIDPRPYQAALDEAKASLAVNQAALELARQNFARASRLLPTKAISQEDYDTQKSAVASSEAKVQTSRAQIETARVNLDYTNIAAPISGRTGKQLVDVGNTVAADGGTALVVIQQMTPIFADFIVPEQDLSRVRRSMENRTLAVLVRLGGEPESAARRGKLTLVDNTAEPGTGTVALRAELPNKDRHFWPGQFVRVRLVLNTLHGAVLIPHQATMLSQNGHHVYVLAPGPTVQIRPVHLGQRHGEMVVVTEGLAAGEKVVVQGQLTARPGAAVRVRTQAAAESSSRPASAAASASAPARQKEPPP